MKQFRIVGDDISDGYHTFDELYEHRVALYLRLCKEAGYRVSFKLDYEQWFCVYLSLPEGQISYHVPNKLLPMVKAMGANEIPKNFEYWDGHKSEDVIKRLLGDL